MVNSRTGPVSIEEFLALSPNVRVRAAAQRLMDVAQRNAAAVEICDTGVSIRYPTGPGWLHPISVAWLHPGKRRWMTDREFVFGVPLPGNGSEPLPRKVRKALQIWVDSFEGDDFAEDVSTVYFDAWAVSHEAVVQHIDELAARLERLLAELHAIHLEDLEDVRIAEEALEGIRIGEERTYSEEEVRAQLGLDD